MDLFEALEKRHSYRGAFKDEALPRENLKRIAEAARLAPSGKNAQTTSFVLVDDPGLLNQITTMPGANKALQTARALIACIVDKQPEATYEGHAFQIEDCAAAVENMLLSITALGYASVWIDGWLRIEGRAEAIGRLLGVPDSKAIRVLLPVGVPAQEVRSQVTKMPIEERAWFNRYGQPE